MLPFRSALFAALLFGFACGVAVAAPDPQPSPTPTTAGAELPSDFLVEPKPVLRVYWPAWLCCAQTRHLLIDMRNTAKQPVAFQPPKVLSLTDQRGDKFYAVALPQTPAVDASKCRSPLAPGEACALDVAFAGPLPPGQYSLDVGVMGAAGGWSQQSVKIAVRHTFLLTFVVIAAGVTLGWYVQNWRSSGRRAFAGLLAIAQLRDRLRRVARSSSSPALKAIETPIEDELAAVEARCQAGDDVSANLDGVGERLAVLAATAALEPAYAALPAEGRAALGAQRNALLTRAAQPADAAARTAFDSLRRALATNINDWPRLDAALRAGQAAHAVAVRTLQLPPPAATLEPLETADRALSTALGAAVAVVAVENVAAEVAARADALTQAKAGVETAADAAAKAFADAAKQTAPDAAHAQAIGAAEATLDLGARVEALARATHPVAEDAPAPAAPATPTLGLDMPIATLFDLSSGRTVAQLRREARIQEWATNLVVLFATSLSGVVLLAPNESWGAGVDVISAFLGGFGARVVLGELGAAATPSPK